MVSPNSQEEDKNLIRTMYGMNIVDNFDKNLGAPVLLGRSKTQLFMFLIERFQQKLQGWKTNFLFPS